MAASTIAKSSLMTGGGTDTEFSGGAAGWEVASQCLEAAFAGHGFEPKLRPLAACDLCQYLKYCFLKPQY